MIIMMMASFDAGFATNGIFDGIVSRRNAVNNTFFQKRLKGSINGNPIVLGCKLFYVLVLQSSISCKKNFQYLFSA